MDEVESLDEVLRDLIEGSTTRWSYAIFWRSSRDPFLLNFGGGHYKGTTKTKVLRIFGSSVAVADDTDTDTDCFFNISKTIMSEDDFPISMSFKWLTGAEELLRTSWKRCKQGLQFGIQTFLFIPFRNGLLELGSTQIIPCNFQRIKEITVFIHRIGSPRCSIVSKIMEQLWNDKKLPERANNETQNQEHDFSNMQFRGKEKISYTKFCWPSLTDSSDTGTHRALSHSHEYSGPS